MYALSAVDGAVGRTELAAAPLYWGGCREEQQPLLQTSRKKIIAYEVQDFNVIVWREMCTRELEGFKKKKKKAVP